jgi:hypothetical protein
MPLFPKVHKQTAKLGSAADTTVGNVITKRLVEDVKVRVTFHFLVIGPLLDNPLKCRKGTRG